MKNDTFVSKNSVYNLTFFFVNRRSTFFWCQIFPSFFSFRMFWFVKEKQNLIFLFHGERKNMGAHLFPLIEIKLSSRMVSLSQLSSQNRWKGKEIIRFLLYYSVKCSFWYNTVRDWKFFVFGFVLLNLTRLELEKIGVWNSFVFGFVLLNSTRVELEKNRKGMKNVWTSTIQKKITWPGCFCLRKVFEEKEKIK